MSPAAMIKTSAALYATLTGRERRGKRDHIKRWRDWEFSSISCLCSWLKEGFAHHFMSWKRGVGLHLFFIVHNIPLPPLTATHILYTHWGIGTWFILNSRIQTCVRCVDIQRSNPQTHLHKTTTASGLPLQQCCYLLWHLWLWYVSQWREI